MPGGKWQFDLPVTNGPASNCTFVAGTRLAVWNAHAESMTAYDVATGRPVSSWSDPDLGGVRPVTSADGRWCLARGAKETGHLRELPSGRARGTVPTAGMTKADFSADGQQLAITYRSGMVRRWRLPSLEECAPIRSFFAGGQTMTFSPDGRHLAAGGGEGEYALMLWDVESGHPMLLLRGDMDTSSTREIRFSGDGSTVAVLHNLGTFDIRRAPSWKEIAAAELREKAENEQPQR